ncbi:MAG: hypothetical protein JNL57_13130 [Bacteroidetes bacterium]|nr:hypothetical protein [Bacteroidota bacterium]
MKGKNNNGEIHDSIELKYIGKIDVTDCFKYFTGASVCNSSGGSFQSQKINKLIFADSIFSNSGRWTLFISDTSIKSLNLFVSHCCRSDIYTNLKGSNNLYTHCNIYLDKIRRCSSQTINFPTSNNPCFKPYKYTNYYYSPEYTDAIEGDSVAFRITPLKTNPDSVLKYYTPYSFDYPFTGFCVPTGKIRCPANTNTKPIRGFYFDSLSATVAYYPTRAKEISSFGILVREFRKTKSGTFVQITENYNEIFGYTDSPGINFEPVQYGFKTLSNACPGDSLHFEFYVYDSFNPYFNYTNDTITCNVPGGKTITKRISKYVYHVIGSVFISANNSGKSFPITISVKDNFPLESKYLTKVYSVNVRNKPERKRNYNTIGNRLYFDFNDSAIRYNIWVISDVLSDSVLRKTNTRNSFIDTQSMKVVGANLIIEDSFGCSNLFNDTIFYIPKKYPCLKDSFIGCNKVLIYMCDSGDINSTYQFIATDNFGRKDTIITKYPGVILRIKDNSYNKFNLTITNSNIFFYPVSDSLYNSKKGLIKIIHDTVICKNKYTQLNTKYKPFSRCDSIRWTSNHGLFDSGVSIIYFVSHHTENFKVAGYKDYCVFTDSLAIFTHETPSAISIHRTGDSLYSDSPAAQYQWYLNDTAIVGAVFSSIALSGTGPYKLRIWNQDGCDTISPPFQVTTLRYNKSHIVGIRISPNPSTGDFQITSSQIPIFRADIYSAEGRKLQENLFSGTKQAFISLPATQGLYLVQVNGAYWEKIWIL